MALADARGLSTSTTNPASLERYERSLALLHGYYGDPLSVIDAAIEEDPAFVLGHALRAALLITAGDNAVEPLLRESVEKGEKLLDTATDRERRHLFAARAWLQRDFDKSMRLYGDIAVDYPRDSLALQVAHLGDFLLGQSLLLRDRIARALPAWSWDSNAVRDPYHCHAPSRYDPSRRGWDFPQRRPHAGTRHLKPFRKIPQATNTKEPSST